MVYVKKRQALSPAAYSYKLLSYRPRTVYELRKSLLTKGFSSEQVNQTIAALIDDGYLNDIVFGEAWINDRININYRGSFGIRRELKTHGMSNEDIEFCLEKFYHYEVESECLAKCVQSITRNLPDNWQKDEKTVKKITNKLIYKGFSLNKILSYLKESQA